MTDKIRILHTGDWHIGSFPGPEKDGENCRAADIRRCLEGLVGEAVTLHPDVIVVAGDIFHQARVWSDRALKESQVAIETIRQLAVIAPIVVMRGTPNHDSAEQFHSLELAFEYDRRVHIVTEPCVHTLSLDRGETVQIACLPGFDRGYYRSKHPGLSKEDENAVFTAAIEKLIIGLKAQMKNDLPSALVSHFTITGCNMESGQTAFLAQFEPVVYPSTLAAADYDLVCFGHIHRPQQLDGCKSTFYCGAISGLNFNDEGQERGFYIHDMDYSECKAERRLVSQFRRLPTRQFLTIRLDDDDVREINEGGPEWLYKLPVLESDDAAEDKIVRVLYDCTDEHNKAFNHAALENWLYEKGKAFWVQEITPQKISISVDRRSMGAENTPEENLADYLTAAGRTPEEIETIIGYALPIINEATEKATSERHAGAFVPVEIEVHNYRNYRDETFSFEDIRFCTINGANGVGKSSLFMDAILDALFEEPREGDLTGWICNDPEARSGYIKLTFRLGERIYRVTRTRAKSGKATLNISECVEGEWTDRSKEKIKDTQSEIENIIGMDSLTLKACALIMQDQYGLFLQADKEARMNILGSILGLGLYELMEEAASVHATDTNREIRILTDRVTTMTAGLPDCGDLLKEIEEEEKHKRDAEDVIAAESETLDALKRRLVSCTEAADRLFRLRGRAMTLAGSNSAKESAKASQKALLASAIAALAEEAHIKQGVATYNALLEDEKTKIALETALSSLKTQKADMDAKLKECLAAIALLEQKRSEIMCKLVPLQGSIANAEDIEARYAMYEDLRRKLATMEERETEYNELINKRKELECRLADMLQAGSNYAHRVTYEIENLTAKTKLLEDSGCPNPENAKCKFLADAIEAKRRLPELKKDLDESIKTGSAETAKISEEIKAVEAAIDPSFADELAAAKKRVRSLSQVEKEYQNLLTARATVEPLVARLTELDTEIEAAGRDVEEAERKIHAISDRIRDTELGLAKFRNLDEQLRDARKWTELERNLPAAQATKEAAEKRLAELDDELREITEEIETVLSDITSEEAKTAGMDTLKEAVTDLEAKIAFARYNASTIATKIGALTARLEEAKGRYEKAAELNKTINALGVKAAAYEDLKKAFSQDGIPHNIIRSIIPVFEATATNILGQMSHGHMSVEIVTEKVLKSNSKKEVTTLDIIINDSDTGRLPYMSRSGGERVKAALSVILALAEIKSSKAGVQLGFLFIDEPPFLDGEGVQAYCDALEAIQRRYSALKIMAITHDPTMKSRFPQSVDVIKTPEGSKVLRD